MEKHKPIAEFLEKKPLYSKLEIDKYFYHPDRFYELTFRYYCPNEKSIQTFKLILEPEKGIRALESLPSERFTDLFDSYQEDKSINFIHHFSGQCQFCKKYKVNFLLNIFSDGPIPGLSLYKRLKNPSFQGNEINENNLTQSKLYIRKIGQYPPFEINPDKEVVTFFQKQDKEYYKKALICLSQSFGVGAYSYLRRITENEIIRIVESLIEIQTQGSEKINEIYEAYKSNKQMSNLVEGIYKHLPPTLKSLGQNPLKILYSHLSEGIHKDDEETCLKKAFGLDTILKFTIKKLNEEEHELKDIRNVLNSLGH